MCGRFFIEEEELNYIRQQVSLENRRFAAEAGKPLTGDRHPGDPAFVICPLPDGRTFLTAMKWGFKAPAEKKLIFNARSETALTKELFSDSVLHRRCCIPAGGFYEWNRDKKQFTFTGGEEAPLFLAGFWRKNSGEEQFVILTAAADSVMLPVHDRMPVLLDEAARRKWLSPDTDIPLLFQQAHDVGLRISEKLF